MPNEVLIKSGTVINFYGTGFNPADDGTNFTDDTAADAGLTLAGLADGAARQSAKVDLGTPWARLYQCFGAFDFTGETPITGGTVDVYWAPSISGTTGNGNVAGNSGNDAAAGNGAVPSGITAIEFVRQCTYIGTFVTSDDGTVQGGYIGMFQPPTQWGQIVVMNESGDAFENDNVESHIALWPVIDEVQ